MIWSWQQEALSQSIKNDKKILQFKTVNKVQIVFDALARNARTRKSIRQILHSWRQTILADKFYRNSPFYRCEDNLGLMKLSFGKLKVFTMQRISRKKKINYIEDQIRQRFLKQWIRTTHLSQVVNKWRSQRDRALFGEFFSVLKLRVMKQRVIGFRNLKVKAGAMLRLREYARRKRETRRLADALKQNHRKLVLSFCVGIMVDRYQEKVERKERLRQYTEQQQRNQKSRVLKELNQYRVSKMQGQLSAQFYRHVIKTKIITSFKKHTERQRSAKQIQQQQTKVLKTYMLNLWLDIALKKDPKYIEWNLKERQNEPLVYETLLNYKARHLLDRARAELQQNCFLALIKFTTLDRNLKLFKDVQRQRRSLTIKSLYFR